MIIDKLLVLSSAQAITTTAVSDSVIDTLAASDAIGANSWVEFLINTTFTSNGATVQFELQTSSTENFASPVTLAITGALAVANLTAGTVAFRIQIPPGALRYLRANYTVASGPAAAGKVDCRILSDVNVRIGA